MNAKQIRDIILDEHVFARVSVTDSNYISPSKSWVEKKLYKNFYNWLVENNLQKWQKYKDCDNYAFALRVFANMCHAKTMQVYEQAGRQVFEGLSLGVMFYLINGERGRGHAVNFTIQNDGTILYIEPQTGKWFDFTQEEKKSTWVAII